MTDTITFDKRIKGYDHEIARCNGVAFGFRGFVSGTIGVERCPKCHRENYAMAVLDGRCCWCGWEVPRD